MTQQGGLHLKHRPQTLGEVIGNEFLLDSIQGFLDRDADEQPRSYLLKGPSGCGKTTIARIMAREMGSKGLGLQEVNAANYRGIDYIRDLTWASYLTPMEGDIRAWIMDEAHMLTAEAANAFLKVLEDTPPHVRFFLCTTMPDKLLPTIRNRCSHLAVEPLTRRDMENLIRGVAEAEDKTVSKSAIEKLVDAAQGSPRAALTMLDRIIDLPRGEQADGVTAVGESTVQVIDLCRALMGARPWDEVSILVAALRKVSDDAESCRRAVLGYCTTALLKSGNGQAYLVMDSFRESTFTTGWSGIAMACWEALVEE